MSKSSPRNLSRPEIAECAKALAVMVYRFIPNDCGRHHHAQEIAESLGNLPHSTLSALHVEIDTLKKALSNESMRHALDSILPGKFEFVRSSTRFDGPFAFPRGYQIKFLVPVEASSDYNRDIRTLRGSLTAQNSVEDSTEAKIHSWDNKPAPEKDLHEEAAKRMRTNELRKTLKLFFVGDVEMCIKIDRMPKGESGQYQILC
jgi:hypothetical protein